jgi:hypothetical protein
MRATVARNSLGLLSIALAAASVAAYMLSVLMGGNLAVLITTLQLGTVASLLVGIAAVLRARRRAASFALAIAGLVLGGTLTLLWVAWIVGLMLNPGAIGE